MRDCKQEWPDGMDDDLISDRKHNFLLERLKSGEALIQGPEDVAVEVIEDWKNETLEKWRGEPIERLTAFHDFLRKQRRHWQNRVERLKKETTLGPYVEDARAHARLNAKYAKWEAEAIGELLRKVRHEGPRSNDGVGGNPGLKEAEVRETVRLVVQKIDEHQDASLTTDIFDQIQGDVEYRLRIARDRFEFDIPDTNQTSEWRDALPKLKERF